MEYKWETCVNHVTLVIVVPVAQSDAKYAQFMTLRFTEGTSRFLTEHLLAKRLGCA